MSQGGSTTVVTIKTFIFKVSIDCKGCEKKIKKALKKIDGVYTTTMVVDKGMVIVSGTVDSPILIKKLKKIGKLAELLPPDQGGNNDQSNNNEAQSQQAQGGPQVLGGRAKKGQRQQPPQAQPQQVVGGGVLEEQRLPLLNNMQLPSYQDQVSVNLDMGDGWAEEISDIDNMADDGLDDGPDEVVAQPNVDGGQNQPPVAAAAAPPPPPAASGDPSGNKVAGGKRKKRGKGANKGGAENQAAGGSGPAGNNGPQQAPGGAGTNNKGAIGGSNAVAVAPAPAPAPGMDKGGGANNAAGGPGMPAKNMTHGFNGMNLPGGGVNMGPMVGNIPLPPMSRIPLPPMGNIPVAPGAMPTGPEMNVGQGNFQGPKPPTFAANPYHRQPYPAAMMMAHQPPPHGMFLGGPLTPAYLSPPHYFAGERHTSIFSDEEANGCSIM